MRYLILLIGLGIVLASCGQKNALSPTPSLTGSSDSTLSKEFLESGLELDLEKLSDNLRIFLVDAPTDEAKSVQVTIEELGIHRNDPNGEWIRVDMNSQKFDLLSLRDGVSGVLADITLDPGHYNLLRLKVSEGTITMNNDEVHSLCIPDQGRKSHIQMNIDLTIDEETSDLAEVDQALDSLGDTQEDVQVEEETYGLVVDFDAQESIAKYNASDEDIEDGECTYVLRPTLKLKRAAKLFKNKQKRTRKAEQRRERLNRAKDRLKERLDRLENRDKDREPSEEESPDESDSDA